MDYFNFSIYYYSFLFLKITTYIMKPSSNNLDAIAGIYGERKNSLDVVLVGGSATCVYWEALTAFEKEGIASYNYGADTMEPELYKLLIKELLELQNPELIIIEARPFQYREELRPATEVAYRNTLTGMPLSMNKIEFIHNNVNKYLGQDDISYYFDIIKYHRDIKGEKINNQIEMALGTYKNETKGFRFVEKVEAQSEVKINEPESRKPIDKETEKILRELLEYIKTIKTTKFLFVLSPYVIDDERKANFNCIEDIIEEYGYDFLDGNDYYDEMEFCKTPKFERFLIDNNKQV